MNTRKPDQTRQDILAAAFSEIHRQGFQAASVANILADTGLTKGALYHHFPDKKALGLAVIDEVIRPSFTAATMAPIESASSPLAALRALLDYKRETMSEEYLALGCPINNLMQEMSPLDEDFRVALSRLIGDWQDTLTRALTRARANGEVRAAVDPNQTALFIVSSLWGCIGVAKSLRSIGIYRACLGQLTQYLDTLSTPPEEIRSCL